MDWFYGCHLSSHDIFESINEVNNYGGNLIQIFVSNPIGKPSNNTLIKYTNLAPQIKKYCIDHLTKIVIHSPYTLNFAKNFDENAYWIQNFIIELKIAHEINAIGCVIHVGKSINLDINHASNNMFISFKYIISIIKKFKLNSIIILETPAGQGSELLVSDINSIDELANFYHRFSIDDKKYIKICVDTCHIFSAGFDISSKKKARFFFFLFDKIIGLQYLALIHFNDSKTTFNSHIDRHEQIGKGNIKLSGLIEFLKQTFKYKIPLILETHGNAYKKEIPWIRKIISLSLLKKNIT